LKTLHMKGRNSMWFAKLLDFLRIKRAIWIQLYDGTSELTWISYDSPFGPVAYRFPICNIRKFTLLPDGKVKGGCYINSWEYYRK
jgi:hypothetical protein